MNADWKVSMLNSMPTCGKIADCCAEKHSLCGVMIYDGLNRDAMVFIPMAQASPKPGAKDLLYKSKFDPWVDILVFAKGNAGPGKAFPRKHAFVDISVFLWLGKQRPRFAQGQPKGYGTSSSQAWRSQTRKPKDLLCNLNLIHELTSLFSPKVGNFCRFAQEGLPSKQAFVDISVFLWLRKQRPRFAQGQPKGYSNQRTQTTQAIERTS